MPGEAWTVERIDLLRKLWAEGETATAIAARLGGISRSAVLGKVFRLRLCVGGGVAASQAQKKTKGRDRSEKAGPLARRRRSGKRDNRPRCPPAGRQGKTLFELTNDSCRWPHGRPGTERFFFCGATGADLERGIPYCARHMRHAYPTIESIVPEDRCTALRGPRPMSSPVPYGRPRASAVRVGRKQWRGDFDERAIANPIKASRQRPRGD